MTYCEDFPACGHTNDDPCGPQWYDAPGAFDTSIRGNEHALCDHENGDCDVDYDEPECDGDYEDCPDGGCSFCWPDDDGSDWGPNEDAAMEFGLFGSEA